MCCFRIGPTPDVFRNARHFSGIRKFASSFCHNGWSALYNQSNLNAARSFYAATGDMNLSYKMSFPTNMAYCDLWVSSSLPDLFAESTIKGVY